MNWLTLLVLLVQLANGQSAASPLNRIQAKIRVAPVINLTPVQIAGQYANPSKELVKRVGPPLSGDNLYIFPDKTYVFCRWADVMENTIFDKGAWSFAGGILELKSDPEITWDDPELERRFLVVRRSSHTEEILLVGINRAVPYFEKNAGDDPELMLLIVGMQKENIISQSEGSKLKANLMRTAWRPDFFRK
jgi:hypothetical protein